MDVKTCTPRHMVRSWSPAGRPARALLSGSSAYWLINTPASLPAAEAVCGRVGGWLASVDGTQAALLQSITQVRGEPV